MGGGQTTPSSESSGPTATQTEEDDEGEESVATAGQSTNDAGGDPNAEERFFDASEQTRQQVDEFVDDASEDGSSDEDTREGDTARADSEGEGGIDPGTGGAAGAGAEAGGMGSEPTTGSGDGTAETVGSTDADVGAETSPGSERAAPDGFDVSVPVAAIEAENAGEFARGMFSEGALSERARSGEEDVWGVETAAEPGTDRIGSWSGFDEDNISLRESLQEADANTGVTASYMEVAAMNGENVDSFRAFITDYSNDPQEEVDRGNAMRRVDVPGKWQGHAQMAASEFSRACGVRTPEHTYDPNDEYVAVAGLNGMGRPDAEPITEIGEEAASKVDRQEFVDVCATQQLAGNNDLHSQNMFVDDEGGVHCIDYDRATQDYDDMASMEVDAHKAQSSAESINRRRDDEFDVDAAEITDRAQELAVALDASGQKERVLQTVAQYDNEFENPRHNHEEIIRNNIDLAAESAYE